MGVRTGPFIALLAGTIIGTLAAGAVVVTIATSEEGFHRGYAWRVNLADASRAWAIRIMPPGGEWTLVGNTLRVYGRDHAIATAKAQIDQRA